MSMCPITNKGVGSHSQGRKAGGVLEVGHPGGAHLASPGRQALQGGQLLLGGQCTGQLAHVGAQPHLFRQPAVSSMRMLIDSPSDTLSGKESRTTTKLKLRETFVSMLNHLPADHNTSPDIHSSRHNDHDTPISQVSHFHRTCQYYCIIAHCLAREKRKRSSSEQLQ